MRKTKKVGIPFRTLLALLSVALLFGGAIGGTFAWLTSTPDPVTNIFTVGNIVIDLKESKYDKENDALIPAMITKEIDFETLATENKDYKFVPGKEIPKNPTVKVDAGNEECYLFVKIEKSGNWPTGATYAPASGWTVLNSASTGNTTVYWRTVNATTDTADAQVFPVLDGNKVTVANTVTGITGSEATLTFTAYAIQKYGMTNESDAWTKVTTPANP